MRCAYVQEWLCIKKRGETMLITGIDRLTYAETRIILAKLFWYFDLELLPEFVNWQSSQQGTVAWHRTPLKCKLTPVQKE